MSPGRLRVALDANVLIAGVRLPRWPHEVMRSALLLQFDLALPEQIIEEAARHLTREQFSVLQLFLDDAACELIPMPPPEIVQANLALVRSEKDVPIALALLAGRVDVFVTNDRDFTDPDATHQNFRAKVKPMLPAVFLRDVMGWTSERLEAIRERTWDDLPTEET